MVWNSIFSITVPSELPIDLRCKLAVSMIHCNIRGENLRVGKQISALIKLLRFTLIFSMLSIMVVVAFRLF